VDLDTHGAESNTGSLVGWFKTANPREMAKAAVHLKHMFKGEAKEAKA